MWKWKLNREREKKIPKSRGGIACVYSYIIEIKKSLKSTRRVACEARLKFCAVCGVTNMCVRESDTQEWAGEGEKWKFIISEKRKIIGVLTAFHYYRESLERRVKMLKLTVAVVLLLDSIECSWISFRIRKKRKSDIPLRIKVDGQIKLYNNIHNNSIGRTATKARQLNLAPHYSIRALVYTMCDNIVVPRR